MLIYDFKSAAARDKLHYAGRTRRGTNKNEMNENAVPRYITRNVRATIEFPSLAITIVKMDKKKRTRNRRRHTRVLGSGSERTHSTSSEHIIYESEARRQRPLPRKFNIYTVRCVRFGGDTRRLLTGIDATVARRSQITGCLIIIIYVCVYIYFLRVLSVFYGCMTSKKKKIKKYTY